MASRRTLRSTALASGALLTVGVVGLAAASPALSAGDDPQTVVRQSVQTLMDPTGAVKASRVYTQVQSSGTGDVSFVEQLSGSLRNLNSFGQPAETSGDQATWNYTVDGLSNDRTLQDYPAGDLPITVKATATLDGQPIDVPDIVGKSGLLVMTYEIENVTGEEQEITWTDGAGRTQSKTVMIPLPYVGSMETVLPDSYAEISAPGASVGGTGRNSTQLSYTLLLYPPLGSTKATVSYQARITDAEVPAVNFTFLPTPPSGNPTTKSALEQYLGGQETGAKLTDGATQIDTNLLKLAAGAGQLNEGLAKLLDGAQQISTGLNETAVPGANQLADGSQQVADGNADLAEGLNDTALPGANQLAAGSAQLADGLVELKAGLATLPSTVYASTEFKTLIAAFDEVIAGIGGPNDTPTDGTLTGGLNGLVSGLTDLKNGLIQAKGGVDQVNTGLGQLKTGVDQSQAGVDQSKAGVDQSKGGVDQVKAGLDAALVPGTGGIAQLDGGVALAKATAGCAGDAACVAYLTAVQGGLTQLRTDTTTASGALGQVSGGLGQVSTGLGQVSTGLGQVSGGLTSAQGGLTQVSGGLGQAIAGIGSANTPGQTLLYGAAALRAGVYSPCNSSDPGFPDNCGLSQVVGLLQGGVYLLVEGISDSLASNPDLALLVAGGAQIADGTEQLADGLADAASGSAQLADGSQQVADGNADLAEGLTTAADGSTQVADGLEQAVPGGTQIEDGAGQLSVEGTKALIQAGQETTNSFGEKAATMVAIDEAAKDGAGNPNGNAESLNGAEVTTTGAFGYYMDGASQSQSQNGLRFLIAALLLAGAVGVGVVFARS